MIAEAISIFFRLLNFAVLFALLGYLFKQYVLPTLKADMQAQQAVQHALEQERDVLAERQTIVDKEIGAQEHVRDQLLQKIQVWQAHFNEEAHKRSIEKELLQVRLATRMQEQRNHYALEQMQRKIIPSALKNAREQLNKDFMEHPQKNQAYMSSIVNYLENA